MNPLLVAATLACGLGEICLAARCTTVLDPRVMGEYQNYVAAAEQTMAARFDAGELSWAPASSSQAAAGTLASGKLVARNISDASFNERIAGRNGTVIHWIGAIQIRGGSLADLKSVLEDYAGYCRMYQRIVFESRASRTDGPVVFDEIVLGLHSRFRFAALFPQHYAFRAQGRIDWSDSNLSDRPALRMHLRADDIRESDSGAPGRNDLLERYHDHGIMWALNAYWRARQQQTGLYLEFETITLARSVQAFACKIGPVPVPKSIVAAAMDSLPAESVAVILEGTKVECERRSARRAGVISGQ
jgi:hypothetical protein